VRQRDFWLVQLMVAATVSLHLAGGAMQDRSLVDVPEFVWVLLLLVPVVYAGTISGLGGALEAAILGSALTVPLILVFAHGRVATWGAWSDLAIVFVIAVVVGQRYEVMRATAIQRAAFNQRALDDQRFRLAFENNMAAMAVIDLQGRVVRVNDALTNFLLFPREEIVGRDMEDFTHPDDIERSRDLNRRLFDGATGQARIIKRYVRADGSLAVAEMSKSMAKDDEGRPLFAIASIRDITDQEALTSQLAHQALHDSLTGLANRALMSDRLDHALELLRRRGGRMALFLLDLDNFKEVNDTLGHQAGDQLLTTIATKLETMVRASDTVSRFGGDEFVYLAEDVADLSDVHRLATRLQAVFAEPYLVGTNVIRQGVSIGIVVCDDALQFNGEDLLRDADIAMYEAKRQGRERYVIFDSEMSKRSSLHFTLSQDLKFALSRREISMHYQPIVALGNGDVVGFEALMRWRHPVEGLVSPDVFIPLAERSDFVLQLGEFALTSATFDAAQWRDLGAVAGGPYITVNLSARQFHDARLFEIVSRVLSESGLAPNRLALEVTEGVALTDIDTAVGVLERLRQLDVVTALDDFGTGYSSLAYLARLRPDVIKIDRSFLAAALNSPFDRRVLESLVALCHRLDMFVLAEGVETVEQVALLREMGCSLGQGFLFSPAVPAEDVRGVSQSMPQRWPLTTPRASSAH
jgi:diguanylate cyclase (GGDEF)-like protein/PAS domain S-box-containing protein